MILVLGLGSLLGFSRALMPLSYSKKWAKIELIQPNPPPPPTLPRPGLGKVSITFPGVQWKELIVVHAGQSLKWRVQILLFPVLKYPKFPGPAVKTDKFWPCLAAFFFRTMSSRVTVYYWPRTHGSYQLQLWRSLRSCHLVCLFRYSPSRLCDSIFLKV